jgi:hypothetical protein
MVELDPGHRGMALIGAGQTLHDSTVVHSPWSVVRPPSHPLVASREAMASESKPSASERTTAPTRRIS